MSKKAAFVVRRNLYYKFFGTIIERFLSEGVEVHLLHYPAPELLSPGNQKTHYYPFLSQVPAFSGPTHPAIVRDDAMLAGYLSRHGIRNVYSLESRAFYRGLPAGTVFHAVQHGIDSFKETEFDADFFYVYAQGWLQDGKFSPRHIGKLVETGIYYLDDPERYDRERIREKYGLPSGRFVLYCPLPSDHGSSYPFLGGKIASRVRMASLIRDELRILRELKAMLAPLDRTLLIKSRFKRILPPEYSEFGATFYDESYFPSSVAELLAVSDLLVCDFLPSAICTEAAALGKRYVVLDNPAYRERVLEHSGSYVENLFLPNGARDLIPARDLRSIPELARLGAEGRDPLAAPAAYIDRFVSRLSAREKMDAFSAHLA